jgi:HK97 family phage portal protein
LKLKEISNWFTSLFVRTKNFFTFRIGNREVVPDIDATTAIEQGFNGNSAVYTIVTDDCEKFASIPRYVYNAKDFQKHLKDSGKREVQNNELSKLLERPNSMQGQAAFFKLVRAYYKITGEAFIWLNRGDVDDMNDNAKDTSKVLEMYVLPTNHVDVVPDPDNLWGVLGYILRVGAEKVPIRKNDCIHWKTTNLMFDSFTRSHLRGMPPLKAGAKSLQGNIDSSLASVRMFQNDGAKGALFNETFNDLSPEQKSQVENVINRKVNAHDVKGAVASLLGKWGYLNFGGTSVDMQLLEARNMSWRELCALLGVPYEFYNTETTYANKEQAQNGWVSNKIIPASKELDDELNRVLPRAFMLEGKALIACDYTELPELQEDMKMLSEWLNISDEITPNEKRIAKGFEPRPEPEYDEPWHDGRPLSKILSEDDDGFQELMTEIQAQKPTNGALNGKN